MILRLDRTVHEDQTYLIDLLIHSLSFFFPIRTCHTVVWSKILVKTTSLGAV